jgi:predicted MFS family arabinose efflux permease
MNFAKDRSVIDMTLSRAAATGLTRNGRQAAARQQTGRDAFLASARLEFFMADMQSGIGPFIGVFLLQHGWASGLIGTAMTVGNVADMLITTPVGAFSDASRHKRLWVIIPGAAVVAASFIILVRQDFWAVAVSQIATSVAGAAIVPAVTGITLGIVRQRGFNRQNGLNQAFNHAGNMVGAAYPDIWAGNSATWQYFCWRPCSA